MAFLYNLKDATGRLARIRPDLAEFVFDIEYIKGETNVVADALSRIKIETLRDDYVDKYEVLSTFNLYAMTRSKTKELKSKTKTSEICNMEKPKNPSEPISKLTMVTTLKGMLYP